MPLADLTAAHIAAQQGSFEPQRGNNALVRFDIDPEGLLVFAVSTFPLPKLHNEPLELQYLNETRKFAGAHTVDDMDFTFTDYIDNPVALKLLSWYQRVFDLYNGKIGLARNYKSRGDLTLYGPNGEFDRRWELIGCWPSSFDAGDIDMSSGEPVKINMTITIDKAIPADGLDAGVRL